ncbi:hypothetical protein IGI04_001854, partial [Brassica rapa subsp. trilocularis]
YGYRFYPSETGEERPNSEWAERSYTAESEQRDWKGILVWKQWEQREPTACSIGSKR